MRIGVDASCWTNRRGYGRYTRELLSSLLALDRRNEYCLLMSRETARLADDLPDSTRADRVLVETTLAPTDAAGADGNRSPRDLWAMTRALQCIDQKFDVFFFPSVYTYFPAWTPAKVVVTIHDTIAESFPSLIFPNLRARLFWDLKVRLAIRRADLVATVSQASRRKIARHFHLDEDAIRVIPDAVGDSFRPPTDQARYGQVLRSHGVEAGQRFLLYVGGISPHKNLTTLVEAFASLVRESASAIGDVKLLLVGDYERDVFLSSYQSLRAQIAKLGLQREIAFTGFVADDDLPYLYGAAEALVMPSLDEGFGLPAAEAISCGTPVLASRVGALPEVVADAGLFFDPRSADELKARLLELLANDRLRAQLAARSIERAQIFSWERSAQAALAVFDEAGASLRTTRTIA